MQAHADVLRVASNPTFPPFEFVDSNTKEVTGFEMDLLRAAAKKAGHSVEIKNIGFDGIIPAILTHSVDMGASGFSITPERQKRVLFSQPIYTSGLAIAVQKNDKSIQSEKDLKGKRVAVQIGTTSAAYAKKIEGAQVVTFNNASEAVLDLVNGGAHAMINDLPVTAYILTQQPKFNEALKVLPQKLSADHFAWVYSKKNTKLANQMDAALTEMKKNGEYQVIYKKWFGNN